MTFLQHGKTALEMAKAFERRVSDCDCKIFVHISQHSYFNEIS